MQRSTELRDRARAAVQALSDDERDLARQARQRFATSELSPADLAIESERWEQHLRVLRAKLQAMDDVDCTTRVLLNGIAYAEHRLEQITRQLGWVIRASGTRIQPLSVDFDAARHVDLVGLAETLLSAPARPTGRGRYRIRCPFHEDRTPSLVIYPPGEGWWCPVCGKGGQDAASFCAEYFHCSQVEGLRWVEQMADGVRAS